MYKIICAEVDKKDCLFCEYGEIPEGEKPPFPVCSNHIVILQFVLDKAGIFNTVVREENDWEIPNNLS